MKRPHDGIGFYLGLAVFLILFAVPYLTDIVYCEGLSHAVVLQTAFLDEETVDPYDDEASCWSSGQPTTVLALPFSPSNLVVLLFQSELNHATTPLPLVLASRPPPIS